MKLNHHLGFKKLSLVVLILALIATGYYLYIKGLAASESITLAGCNRLQQESSWRNQGSKCMGPNGVTLLIIR